MPPTDRNEQRDARELAAREGLTYQQALNRLRAAPPTRPAALVLVDQPEDGVCEDRGWVQATVTEDQARDLLAPMCFDDDGRSPARPAGPAKRVLLAPEVQPDGSMMWFPAHIDSEDPREFYEFDATNTTSMYEPLAAGTRVALDAACYGGLSVGDAGTVVVDDNGEVTVRFDRDGSERAIIAENLRRQS